MNILTPGLLLSKICERGKTDHTTDPAEASPSSDLTAVVAVDADASV